MAACRLPNLHFSFNLLKIKGLYMFRALRTHPQKVLNKRDLLYCVRVSSVCSFTATVQPTAVFSAPSEDKHVMLEIRRVL
jgi:hypothetical protein